MTDAVAVFVLMFLSFGLGSVCTLGYCRSKDRAAYIESKYWKKHIKEIVRDALAEDKKHQ